MKLMNPWKHFAASVVLAHVETGVQLRPFVGIKAGFAEFDLDPVDRPGEEERRRVVVADRCPP